MKDLLCPQCGAALKFTTVFSVSTVCSFCTSLVVRQDLNLELLGKESLLQDNMNPLQVGTRGQFLGTGFSLIGGVRLNHHEGHWQEWFLQLDQSIQGSRFAWLAQAQGEYQFLFEPIELPVMTTTDVEIDDTILVSDDVQKKLALWSKTLAGNREAFKVIDSRTANMTHFMGELPWAPDKNRTRTIAELASAEDVKLTVELASSVSFLYFGRIMNFEDFKFQNLKEVQGW